MVIQSWKKLVNNRLCLFCYKSTTFPAHAKQTIPKKCGAGAFHSGIRRDIRRMAAKIW
jgi:hypothetical protein